jgi:hypothetical protein
MARGLRGNDRPAGDKRQGIPCTGRRRPAWELASSCVLPSPSSRAAAADLIDG